MPQGGLASSLDPATPEAADLCRYCPTGRRRKTYGPETRDTVYCWYSWTSKWRYQPRKVPMIRPTTRRISGGKRGATALLIASWLLCAPLRAQTSKTEGEARITSAGPIGV